MQLERVFHVACTRERAAECLGEDELLLDLFPESETRIVARKGERRTVESRYELLGKRGVATFHFDRAPNGDLHFQKVCDGRVWRELTGCVLLEHAGAGTEIRLELEGRTKALVPELAIRMPLQEHFEQMSCALKAQLDNGSPTPREFP
jgi:hypothetical protein